jgi:CRISPR/Cas system endoribonuclease Cas6 (RAMP superfamily)
MPRSVIVYLEREASLELRDELKRRFEGQIVKPYTVSHAQRMEGERLRLRITELMDDMVFPVIAEVAERMSLLFVSSADRDVKSSSYQELIEDGDRSETSTTVQLVSPTIVEILHEPVPFPVMPLAIARYISLWNTFAPMKFPLSLEALKPILISDFKVSCMSTPYGAGCQGWVTVEIGRGMTEEYIGLVNSLIDFAFYGGTGLHTDEGLGQTRRIERKVQTTK